MTDDEMKSRAWAIARSFADSVAELRRRFPDVTFEHKPLLESGAWFVCGLWTVAGRLHGSSVECAQLAAPELVDDAQREIAEWGICRAELREMAPGYPFHKTDAEAGEGGTT